MSNPGIRLSKSCVGAEEVAALTRIITEGYLGMGQEVKAFENDLRTYLDTSLDVSCVNTGTAALHLAVQALGIGKGDEVLVPSITYVASFQAISATGARPVACDVTANRVFIDLNDARLRVTSHTKAIMPVHYASDSQDMDAVYEFADTYGLRVIEDAAHSFGSIRNGKKIGCKGDILCFSFDGIKNITCGEGGALLTADPLITQRVRDARLLGVEKDTEQRYKGKRSWNFDVRYQGWRYHMSNLMAAIGREQLKKIDRFSHHRKECVSRYRKRLEMPHVQFLDLDYENIIPHLFVVRITDGYRNMLMERLRDCGIECGLHYQPAHLLSLYATDYHLPISEQLGEELLSLPLHGDLTEAEQDVVIDTVRSCLFEKSHA